MEPDCLKGGRDKCIDYTQSSAGCAPNKSRRPVTTAFSGFRLPTYDLVQKFRARKPRAVEVKANAAERWHGILAEYFLIVYGDDRYLVRNRNVLCRASC